MTPLGLTVTICVATFLVSVATSVFVAGVRWGSLRKDIEYIKRDLDTIRSLFQLTLAVSPPKKVE